MLEKLAERYHTTPETIVALNGPDKLIGVGQHASAAERRSGSPATMRAYRMRSRRSCCAALNVEANQPQGDYVVVDKSEGTLKVYRGRFPRLGKTMASSSRNSP